MKKYTVLTVTLFLGLLSIVLQAQIVEVEGKAKIMDMDTVTDVSANVVRQSDGTLAVRHYQIGDIAQGGIIFYVDESGEHGLVADTAELIPAVVRWHAGTNGNTHAKGDGPFAGEMNTALIISSQVAIGDDGNTYAARICSELHKGGYGDWYLPSKEELNLMYINLYQTGLLEFFLDTWYWSSTEINNSAAWEQFFTDGSQGGGGKSGGGRVRAVRAF